MATSFPLFLRAWKVTVGTLALGQVDVEFNVKRTLKPEPNQCSLKIFNLTAAHRQQIQQNSAVNSATKVPVKIEAGYYTDATKTSANLTQIYLGELRAGWTEYNGPDVVTELSSGDAEKAFCTARMNVAFGPGATNDVVMKQILKSLGIGQGNIQKAISQMAAQGVNMVFNTRGNVMKGNAAVHLTNICNSVGLEWSVQNGAAQFLPVGQPLQGQVFQLDSQHGLIGSPSVDTKGTLEFQTFIVPGLAPGVVVKMNSLGVQGGFRIVNMDISGDTLGNDWYMKCQAEKY